MWFHLVLGGVQKEAAQLGTFKWQKHILWLQTNTLNPHSHNNSRYVFYNSGRLFGFVARKQGSTTDNVSHLFAELDPDQPASAITGFVSKMMKRWRKAKNGCCFFLQRLPFIARESMATVSSSFPLWVRLRHLFSSPPPGIWFWCQDVFDPRRWEGYIFQRTHRVKLADVATWSLEYGGGGGIPS